MPHADNIIALDAEGKVAAQGTFSQLNAKDGYIHRFGLEGLKEEASTAKDEEGADSKVDRLQNAEEEAVPKAMDDEARRLGDRTVYKYYFQQVGAVNMTIFFSILLIWIFMLKFPGKFKADPYRIFLLQILTITPPKLRDLAQVVGRCQHAQSRS